MPKPTAKPPRSVVEFLSVEEAAELLRVSQVSIRRWIFQGRLKKYKVGSRTLLRHGDVMALVQEA